ncbi:MAG: PilT/PilU family type 4a pilus ATPase [Candidatus Sumerlaeota bacterium]|nr:PilT/PilU family type 4a pilus ATPase [Candidatus Sumerlaeota bacterium]
MNVDAMLDAAFKLGASDVHLVPKERPIFRIHGDLRRIDQPALSPAEIREAINGILPPHLRPLLEEHRGADFSYQLGDRIRFRCVAYYENEGIGIVFRLIPMKIPTIDGLEFPEVIKTFAMYHRGLVVVTGITGSGKSTTLAAMIDHLNNLEARRIITIEDPIEYIYKANKCVISQREVGKDIQDFSAGLRHALRMDPDCILIGEMRDVETIRIAIKAAETGHLVWSTLHTTNAIHTVQRIISHFDQLEQQLIREQLSLNLKASITQRLVRRCDKAGRIAALEILVVSDVVGKLIREGRIADCLGAMKGRDMGMQIFDQALADLVRIGKMSIEEGSRHCDDFYAFRRYIQGVQSSGEKGSILSAG